MNMPNKRESMLEHRRNLVLKYDLWTCKLCEEVIDALSSQNSDDEKTALLVGHISTRHKNSRDVDTTLDPKYLVCYFKPKVHIIQENENFVQN